MVVPSKEVDEEEITCTSSCSIIDCKHTEMSIRAAHNYSSDCQLGDDNIMTIEPTQEKIGDISPIPAATVLHIHSPPSLLNQQQIMRRRRRSDSHKFITKMALLCTIVTILLLFIMTIFYSEWGSDSQKNSSTIDSSSQSSSNIANNHIHKSTTWQDSASYYYQHHRHLEEQESDNDSTQVIDGDYSSYRCDEIFTNTPTPTYDSSSSSTKRCQYASTCDDNEGLLLPFVFCHTSIFSTTAWLILLSPIVILILTVLFRLLGSTAEDYFSPSLEMFSVQLGLPPRFAGVTLLALGNGAADVSATINAIGNDPTNGYKMSLGALTGAAMFITTVVAGSVILTNGGVVCRGALVRDVMALGVTVVVVALNLEKGEITAGTSSLFISLYIIFVLIVLVADVYHRAVMLPRIKHETEMREHERQLEAERMASQRAGNALNAFAQQRGNEDGSVSGVTSEGGAEIGSNGIADDDKTHATAPILATTTDEFINDEQQPRVPQNRALNAVLTALSNYNDDELEFDTAASQHRPDGWGVESNIEGNRAWDRPIVLRGADGILTRHPHHHHPQAEMDNNEPDDFQSPYMVMEDMDLVDRACVQEGSSGLPAYNWIGAWHDGKQELAVHFREYWKDIVLDDESSSLEKCLQICEYPMTLARKLTISIPCEGSYCRALVALSFALSPLWLGVYFLSNFDVNLWGWPMGLSVITSFFVGAMIMRYAPGGDGTMATIIAVPIALYGFVVAATWIDWIADKLVSLLEFLGIMLRVPNYIMGLTVLAWGNSMADLSANVTMARKGLANMAITACFAGPIFNILIGLGTGFGVLRSVTKADISYVNLTPAITTGFVFCFINCGLLLVSGLAINKGVIPIGYGYAALVIYATYIGTSLLLQFLL